MHACFHQEIYVYEGKIYVCEGIFFRICVSPFLIGYTCVCGGVYTRVQVPIEVRGVRAARDGVIGCCDWPDVDAENGTRVLCKSKMCS